MNRERLALFIRERFVFVKAATIMLWLSWLISIGLSGFTKDIEGKPIGTDHIAFYSAAKLIDERRGELIYDHEFLWDYQPSLVNHPNRFLDAYRNPPFYALLYLPTSRLPYLLSFWIWTAISVILLWLGLGWLGSRDHLAAFIIALSFYPVFAVFSFGQNSVLSFGLFCLTFRILDRGRPLAAGLVAGLLLYKPQLLGGLGLWWLLSFRHYWKSLLGLALTSLFWVGISLLFVPVESRLFLAKLREIAAYEGFMFWNMHNPRAFGTLIAYDDKSVGNIFALVCSIAALICYVLFWQRHREQMPLMFAGTVFLTLWASPHTMIYEWTLALIPAVLLWYYAPARRDDWIALFAVSWVALFVSTFIAKALFESTHGWAVQISVPIMGFVGIWAMRVLRQAPPGPDHLASPLVSAD